MLVYRGIVKTVFLVNFGFDGGGLGVYVTLFSGVVGFCYRVRVGVFFRVFVFFLMFFD